MGSNPNGLLALYGEVKANTVGIVAALSLSDALDMFGRRHIPVAIQMPAAWDAASLTFQGSHDGVTFSNIYFDGAEYTILAAGGAVAGGGISLNPDAFLGWTYIKVRSGTLAAPVAQAAARTITVLTRGA